MLSLLSWLRSRDAVFPTGRARRARFAAAPVRPRVRPCLEALEDRLVPAHLVISGGPGVTEIVDAAAQVPGGPLDFQSDDASLGPLSVYSSGPYGTAGASFSANPTANGSFNVTVSNDNTFASSLAQAVTSGGETIPLSAIITPDAGTNEQDGDPVTISGTASSDSTGATVFAELGSVEVSGITAPQQFSFQAHIGDSLDFLLYAISQDGAGNGDINISYQITPGNTPSFDNLSSPTITYGTATTTISGHLDSGSDQPVPAGETVVVTLNGVPQNATLDDNDDFSTTFDTSDLNVPGSPYTITFAYAGDDNFNSADGNSTLTVIPATPSFDSLSSPTITYGTATTTISGHLDSGSDQPVPAGETVVVTFNGVPQNATLDDNDDFSTTFDTSDLNVPGSPYTITFAYAGDDNFNSADGSSTLTVNKATPSFSNLSAPTIAAGTASTIISGQLDAKAGQQLVPAGESIQITLNGVTQTASLDGSDDFSTPFDTSKLTASGSPYTITFAYAGDDNFNSANDNSTLTVNPVNFKGITLSPATLPAATVGESYSQSITASGGSGELSISYQLAPGASIPSGLTFRVSGSSLSISGTPLAVDVGTIPFTVTAQDQAGDRITQNYTLTVNPAPPLNVPPLLAFFDSFLGGTETVNANGTETITDSFFGFPLLVSTFDSSGNLLSVDLFGFNVTFLFV